MSSLFDKTTNALNTAINMRLMKGNVISSNIANSETPGYHAKKMDFEEALARAVDLDGMRGMTATHPDHYVVGGGSMAKIKPEIYENPEGMVDNDGNTVDFDKEIAAMQENSVMYKAALQLINKKLAALKYAATEGR
jgi:flagellar basal-body rod protein FlgB